MTISGRWSKAETQDALDRRADGQPFEDIAAALDRELTAVKAKLFTAGAFTVNNAKRVQSEGITDRPSGNTFHFAGNEPTLVPGMIEERDRLYEAMSRRDLTATLCGDPPPGCSALDKRRAKESAR